MSTLVTLNAQIGSSGTANQNFTLYQPSTPDGTVRLGVGNSGATTSDVLTINNSGNVGIGVTPSAWGADYKAVQIGNGGSFWSYSAAGAVGGSYISNNSYFNGTNRIYRYSNNASEYVQVGGQHQWHTAPSGTAGNPITFTQAMTLDANGNLGLGSAPGATTGRSLDIDGASKQPLITMRSTGQTSATTDWTLDTVNSLVAYSSSAWPMRWIVNGAERMRLDASGNLLVGTTAQLASEKFNATGANQYIAIIKNIRNVSGDVTIYAEMGANTVNSSSYFINCSTTGLGPKFLVQGTGNVVNTNNSYGAISDVKLKENVVDATPKLEKLNQVRVVNYNLIGEGQKQIGVIAQELEQIFPGMVEETPDRDTDGNDLGTTTKSVKYSVFVPMLIKAIQEQQAIIEQLTANQQLLEARITALESKA